MDSRSRFQALLARRVPDRIPRDYWAVSEVTAKLCKRFNVASKDELLDLLDIDFRYIDGPTYTGPPLRVHGDGSRDDIWGVPRRAVMTGSGEQRGTYEAVVAHPLASCTSVAEVESYAGWPNPTAYDYSVIKAQCDAVKGRVVMFMGDRLNRIAQLKPAMYLRGMERILADMRRKRNDIFAAIVGKIRSFYEEYLRRILAAAGDRIDVIVTGDDFGTQQGMICHPDTWRACLLPGFRSFVGIAKAAGVAVMHHSCGSITPVVPDMIAAGLNILNPVQPGVADMDHAMLKREFGDRLVFHGGISLQGPLRFGTPAQVRDEVLTRIAELGPGGYVICTAHNIQADTPLENVLALFRACDELGTVTSP